MIKTQPLLLRQVRRVTLSQPWSHFPLHRENNFERQPRRRVYEQERTVAAYRATALV